MKNDNKPLYALSVEEYIQLTQKLIADALTKTTQKTNEDKNENSEMCISELAKFLNCTKTSIHNYKKLGMPFYKIGRKILFKKSEVLEFMKGLRNRKIVAFKG